MRAMGNDDDVKKINKKKKKNINNNNNIIYARTHGGLGHALKLGQVDPIPARLTELHANTHTRR